MVNENDGQSTGGAPPNVPPIQQPSNTIPIAAMPEFCAETDQWIVYQERLENFFNVYQVSDERKKVFLLNYLGTSAYKLIRDLSHPLAPSAKSYTELCAILKEYYTQPVIAYKERKEFYNLTKSDGESAVEWLARVKRAAGNCEFADLLSSIVLDKFVTGQSGRIFDRLCEENHTTLNIQRALELSIKFEIQSSSSQAVNAIHNRQHFNRGSSSSNQEKNKHNQQNNLQQKSGEITWAKSKVKCIHCGYSNHVSSSCRFKDATCVRCSKVGHIATVCKIKSSNKKINYVENNTESIYTMSSDFNNANPIYIGANVNGIHHEFMLDSGAGISAIPKKVYEGKFKFLKLNSTETKLFAYSGHEIKVKGCILPEINYSNKTLLQKILVVDGDGPSILGRDFMNQFKLTFSQINFMTDLSLNKLLSKYSSLFDDELGKFKYHKIHLEVQDSARKKFCKPRQMPYSFRDKVDSQIESLIKNKMLTAVKTSDWGTPLVPVLKADGGIRLCADYKVTLNEFLVPNKHPLPRAEDVFNSLQGGVEFSKLDMPNAYNQFELDEESSKLVAWSTHKGVFAVNRLPFGISPATGIFQGEMEKLLQGIPGVVNFVDDIVVTGPTRQAHLANLNEVFKRFSDAGLKLRADKCDFFKKDITFLGHILNGQGLSKTKERVDAVINAPAPRNITEVRAFTGLINYYGKFIKGLAHIMSPIYQLLKKDNDFDWNSNCDKAFKQIKDEIVNDVVLSHFNPSLPIILECDASSYGIGAVLSHKLKTGEERPIAFCSRTLSKAEINYSVIEKEALAIVFAARKFFQYLIGYRFIIRTDHKPLLGLFGEHTGYPQMAASRIQRWSIFLSAFKYSLKYIKGGDNVADSLSRLPLQSNQKEPFEANYINFIHDRGIEIDHKKIKYETARDKLLSKVYLAVQSGSLSSLKDEIYKPFVRREKELSIEQGLLMWGYRVVIPEKLQLQMLHSLHSSHLGIVKCKAIARSYMWYPGIDSQIEDLIKSCKACLSFRPDPPKAELIPWESPGKPWSRIHVDFAGPKDTNYYLIITDAYTKWVEVFKTKSITAEFTISKLREVFSRFGLVDTIVSDNGSQFTSRLFRDFITKSGIKFITSPVCHPASNGAAENSVRSFKKGLICALSHSKTTNSTADLDIIVCRYLFDYRIAPHSTTGISPAKAMFGRELRTRFDLIRPPTIEENILKAQNRQIQNYKGSRNTSFEVDDFVNVKDFTRQSNRWLPAKIVKVISKRKYLCKILNGEVVVRHLNQIIKGCNNDQELLLEEIHHNKRVNEIPIKIPLLPANNLRVYNNTANNNIAMKNNTYIQNNETDSNADQFEDNSSLDQDQVDLGLSSLFRETNENITKSNMVSHNARPKRNIVKPDKLNL